MKVRKKNYVGPTDWIVVEDSPTFYIGHIEVGDGCPVELQLLRKSEFEPVKTEAWRDVTSECDVSANYLLQHDDKYTEETIGQITKKGYRLRKVQMYTQADPGTPCVADGKIYGMKLVNAFIVEKRNE
jgi:hypothetical protein